MSVDLSGYYKADLEFQSGAEWTAFVQAVETVLNAIDGSLLIAGSVGSAALAAGAVIGRGDPSPGVQIKAKTIAAGDIKNLAIVADLMANGIDLSGTKAAIVETAVKLFDEAKGESYGAHEIGCIKLVTHVVPPYSDDEARWRKWSNGDPKVYEYTILASDMGITEVGVASLPSVYTVSVENDHYLHGHGGWPVGVSVYNKAADDFTIGIVSAKYAGKGPFSNPITKSMAEEGATITVAVFVAR